MFKKRTLQRVLALLVCAALLAFAGGCADEEVPGTEDTAGAGPTETRGQPEVPAPAQVLSEALDAARADLEERFAVSPLSGLKGLTDRGAITADIDITVPDEKGEPAGSLAGTVVYSAVSGEARASLTLSGEDIPLELYYGPEFLGVSCAKLFKDGAFYGLRPYGLTEQLAGSALADLVKLDMDAVAELDALLDSVPKDVNVFTAPEVDQMFRAAHELIGKLAYTTQEVTLTRGGEELRGTEFKTVLSAGELADFLKRLSTALPDWVLVYGLGTGDDSAAAVDEALEAIRQSGIETPLTLTVADGRLCHLSAEYAEVGGTVYLEAELYGDNGATILVTAEPGFSFTLDLSVGAVMELNVMDDVGSSTKFGWTPEGEFEFITYRGDITDLALDGTLTASEGRVSYEGIWYSGERGDRNPLKLSTTPGGAVTPPETTRNITELSARELYTALMKAIISLA